MGVTATHPAPRLGSTHDRVGARAWRIAVASSGLGHVTRGIETWAQDLAAALDGRGIPVTLYKGGGRAERAYERVVPCLQRDARKTQRLFRLLPRCGVWRLGLGSTYGVEQATFAVGLIRHLRADEIDLLHVQDPNLALLVQWARRARLVRTRVILGHGTNESPEFVSRIKFLQHLAPWHLEQMKAQGAWRPTWTAIPNFIDTQHFSPGRCDDLRDELAIPRDAVIVGTASAIKRDHKRVDHLIAEFAALRRECPHLPLYLVVAGGYERETDQLIEWGRSLLGDRVRFLVRFPRARMPEFYRAVDVFALCSLREMMPIALIEACASGLPCVTHRHPVLEWIVGAGGCAIDMAQPGRLCDALQSLAIDAGKRQAKGQDARRHAEGAFGNEQVVSRLLEYYAYVVTHHRFDDD